MIKRPLAAAIGAGLLVMAATSGAIARDQIRIVGSSTVFPFASAVAEEFGRSTNYKTPIIEPTGSGGGLKDFCAGVGTEHPDITNASRRIKQSEIDMCAKNGVTDIVEVKIGYDGIVLANSNESPVVDFTLRHIWLALAKEVPANEDGSELIANPYKKWSEIDPSLPDLEIEVLGPPPTSGTRDAFVELGMEGGCKTFPAIKALKDTDKNLYKSVCHSIREDGRYVQAGEKDNLIVKKLVNTPGAFGIFGFSFLDQNRDAIHGNPIGGVVPSFDNISSGEYPVSRSLFFYVKKAHVGSIPGIRAYLAEFTSNKAWGEWGYLAEKGLIPMPEEERNEYADDAAKLRTMAEKAAAAASEVTQ